MISKAEVLQKLKKMGMVVADDASIVTVLLPTEISFETGLKDVKAKLQELGYESSFCIKQSKDAVMQKETTAQEEEVQADVKQEKEEDKISEEELRSFMAVDQDEQFSLDDDGQFTLGFGF